jgi:hypothetical protein
MTQQSYYMVPYKILHIEVNYTGVHKIKSNSYVELAQMDKQPTTIHLKCKIKFSSRLPVF